MNRKVSRKHWDGLASGITKAGCWDCCKEFEVDHKVSWSQPVQQMAAALASHSKATYGDLTNWLLQEMLAAEGKSKSGNKETLIARLVLGEELNRTASGKSQPANKNKGGSQGGRYAPYTPSRPPGRQNSYTPPSRDVAGQGRTIVVHVNLNEHTYQ